jgi:hypothetical protein
VKTYIKVWDVSPSGRVRAEVSPERDEWFKSMAAAQFHAATFTEDFVIKNPEVGFSWEPTFYYPSEKSVRAVTRSGETEFWAARPDNQWVELASLRDLGAREWLLATGRYDLDTIDTNLTVEDAIEALAHDYQSFKIID